MGRGAMDPITSHTGEMPDQTHGLSEGLLMGCAPTQSSLGVKGGRGGFLFVDHHQINDGNLQLVKLAGLLQR